MCLIIKAYMLKSLSSVTLENSFTQLNPLQRKNYLKLIAISEQLPKNAWVMFIFGKSLTKPNGRIKSKQFSPLLNYN